MLVARDKEDGKMGGRSGGGGGGMTMEGGEKDVGRGKKGSQSSKLAWFSFAA